MSKDFSLLPLHTAMMMTDTNAGISFNIDNQRVRIPGKNRPKIVKRTVYRIEINDKQLSGRILLKGEWNRVVFRKVWEISKY